MGRTLLIGSQTGVWREWRRDHAAESDFVGLDPADADSGIPGRLSSFHAQKLAHWQFVGSLTSQRSPHVLLSGVARLAQSAGDDAVFELFPFRVGPLRLQMARRCAEAIGPVRILVDRRARVDPHGWPVPLQEIDLPDPLPESVRAGHRKARWLQLFEQCERHEIDLRRIAVDGLRLGSGIPLPLENLRKYGFAEPLHAEAAGSSILIVSEAPVQEVEVSRALDAAYASKAVVVAPKAYDNLLCAFSRAGGDDYAMGRIVRIRFPEMVAEIQANAIAPASLDTLKVGGLRIDADGRELGELKPWEA